MLLPEEREEQLHRIRFEQFSLRRKAQDVETRLADYLHTLVEISRDPTGDVSIENQFQKTVGVLAERLALRLKALEYEYHELQIKRGAASPDLLESDYQEQTHQSRRLIEDYLRDAHLLAQNVEKYLPQKLR